MSHAEAIAALYDHEQDGSVGTRRRRDAHDWGADDLFDGTPARRRGRFDRAENARPVDSWMDDADDRLYPDDRAAQYDDGLDGLFDDDADRRPRAAADRAPRDERRREVADWFADDDRRRVDDWLAGGRSAQLTAEADALDADLDAEDLPSPTAPTLELDLPLGETRPARRTVTVTGHPDAVRRAERSGEIARRRPAPSLDARIGHRPDRVARWACALGMLLVVVAIFS
jgi:hypothetical protein